MSKRPVTALDHAALDLWAVGKTAPEIAQRLHVPVPEVDKIIARGRDRGDARAARRGNNSNGARLAREEAAMQAANQADELAARRLDLPLLCPEFGIEATEWFITDRARYALGTSCSSGDLQRVPVSLPRLRFLEVPAE